MKPNIAPTSPKYALEKSVAELYTAQASAGLERPNRRSHVGLLIVACLIGLVGGALGAIGVVRLAHQFPSWGFWRTIGWPTAEEARPEVIVRESISVDRVDEDRAEMYERVSAVLVSIYRRQSEGAIGPLQPDQYRGTGLLLTEDGLIAFDGEALAANGGEYLAVLSDGQIEPITVVARDPLSPLGFGRIDGGKYPVAAFASEADFTVGEEIFELAADSLRGSPQLSLRLLGGVNVRSETSRGQPESTDALTRFLRISGGKSDGTGVSVLVDRRGSLVGLRLSGLEPSLAYPVSLIRSALESFTVHGEIERPRLGLVAYDLRTSPGLAASAVDGRSDGAALLELPDGVSPIKPGSPAEQAGFEVGDLIIAVDDQAIDAARSLQELIQKSEIGRDVSIRYVRDGAEQNATVTIGKYQ